MSNLTNKHKTVLEFLMEIFLTQRVTTLSAMKAQLLQQSLISTSAQSPKNWYSDQLTKTCYCSSGSSEPPVFYLLVPDRTSLPNNKSTALIWFTPS